MTNSLSVPSLDVEACVRLLERIERSFSATSAHKATASALKLALPGMGKQLEAGQRALAFVDDAFAAVRRDHLGCDWNGGDIQDDLIHRGFLEPRTVTEPCCGEGCACSDIDYFPMTCYYPTELAGLAAAAARAAQPQETSDAG